MKSISFLEDEDLPSSFHYIPNVFTDSILDDIKYWLDNTTNFIECPSYHNSRYVRYQKWFQKDNKYFCPKWKYRYKRWESFPYLPIIENMEKIINTKLEKLDIEPIDFNSCLINKYRNGDDYIKAHRDSIDSFGEYPTIIGISFGTSRNINFKRSEFTSSDDDFSFTLDDNSMFIMLGSSQKKFVHEIPRCDTDKVRYSLTFRHFIL